jgi:hypothetical protein
MPSSQHCLFAKAISLPLFAAAGAHATPISSSPSPRSLVVEQQPSSMLRRDGLVPLPPRVLPCAPAAGRNFVFTPAAGPSFVFCHVRRWLDGVLPLQLRAPDEHAVPNPEPRRPVASTSPRPHATAARQMFDEMSKRDVVSWNSIVGVYLFSGENHAVRLVSLASQYRLTCCCACSLALLLAAASLALAPAACCAACLHYSAACCECCFCRCC